MVRLAWAGRGRGHVSRGVPRAVSRMGSAAGCRARIDVRLDRQRLAADRRSPVIAGCSRPGESREVTFLLGYTENPATAKFDPPDVAASRDRTGARRHRAVPRRRTGRERPRGAPFRMGPPSRRASGRDRRPARGPDGQHLEPVPVLRHVQPVALGIDVRVGDRAGDGLSRFEPGPPRLRPHGARAGPRANPRHRGDPASRRRRVSPVPAADEARQPRHRGGVQRRPGVARHRRGGLRQGDGRRRDPRGMRRLGQRRGLRDAAPRPPAAMHRLHACTARPARAPAHRTGGLERLPQSECLLRGARQFLPDRAEPTRRSRRVGVHRGAVRARGARGSGACLPSRRRLARPGAAVPRRRR